MSNRAKENEASIEYEGGTDVILVGKVVYAVCSATKCSGRECFLSGHLSKQSWKVSSDLMAGYALNATVDLLAEPSEEARLGQARVCKME